ncbi:MAG: hypothetical protein P8Z35_06965, partial [Ignavibacteriaceae bacterium]
MSNVIKMNQAGSKKLSIRFKSELDEIAERKQPVENQLKIQLKERYEEGFKDGYENASVEIEKVYKEKFIKKVDEFNKILNTVDEKIAGYDGEFENLVIKLSFEIAQKITRRE